MSAVNPNGSVHSDKEINILIPQLYYNENDTNKELLNKVNETLKYHKNKQLYTYGYWKFCNGTDKKLYLPTGLFKWVRFISAFREFA